MLNRLLAFTAVASALAAPALAQDAETAAPDEVETVVLREPIPDVIIWAKRPASLAHAPISAVRITGWRMEADGAHDLKDMQILTSSLLMTSTANEAQTTARLRGIGTVGDNPGLESSVGVVVDGVYRPRTATAMSDLGIIDRVEILRGPQSDVYGKGASAGIIQVVSRLPVLYSTKQSLELTTGNMGAYGVQAYMSAPLRYDLAGSLTLTSRHRDGQYYVTTGSGPRSQTDDNDQNYSSARGQLLYRPGESTQFLVIADYTRRDETCCGGPAIAIGGTRGYIDTLAGGQGTASVVDTKGRHIWSNRPTDQRLIDAGLSAQIDVKINESVQFTSVSAWRHWDHRNGYDADFTAADVYYRNPNGEFGNRIDTWSQEARLNGRTGPFTWMLGAFADQENLTRKDETLYGRDYESYLGLLLSGGADIDKVSKLTGLPVGQSFVQGQGNHDTYAQRERNAALFGHVEWYIDNGVSLLAGARYNRQSKRLTSRFTNSDGGLACAHATASLSVLCLPWSNPAFNNLTLAQKGSEGATTGSLKAKWEVTGNLMAYASYSTGWKGAGYNLDREQTTSYAVDTDSSFKAETSRAYEVGLKARWPWRGAGLDVALFDETFRNFQLNTFLGTTFVVNSIPKLRSRGAELDARYGIGDFAFNTSITYADTRFGPEPVPGLALIANGRASFAPKWSAAYGVDYSRSVGQDIDLSVTLNARYNSAYNTGSDLNPIKEQPAYTLVDGRLALSAPDQAWSLELWGRNLTDVTYKQVAFAAPFQSGTYNAFLGLPRTFGLTLRLKH